MYQRDGFVDGHEAVFLEQPMSIIDGRITVVAGNMLTVTRGLDYVVMGGVVRRE